MLKDMEQISERIDRLRTIYIEILKDPSFDSYERHAEHVHEVYDYLATRQMNEQHKAQLADVKLLHDQLVEVILLEKSNLSEKIGVMEKKKQVSVQYGKQQSYIGEDAYFVDFKR